MEFKTFEDLPELPDDQANENNIPRPILEEVRSLRKHVIPKYPMFIGRDRQAYVCVPVSAVSRKHAKVFEKDGVFYIQDLGSINGTYVNGKRVLDPVPLKPGDRIKISVTKQYKNGAKEFEFKHNLAEQENLKKDRDMLFQDVQIFAEDESTSGNVLLKDCLFYISKKDIVSVIKSEPPRRVAISQVSFRKTKISFHSICPYKVKDQLILSVEHPQLKTMKAQLRVLDTEQQEHYGIITHHCEMIKLTDDDKRAFRDKIDLSPLICYISSKTIENGLEADT
ncbi:FHA domain-containing protein [Candidatus Uabimicrobium sp. HlEnr_7]|uniref:FHA domain-containing protein n=1 Tax=Candidatus Uabimicrobium helgolandensis TaxID=3095367 RepID=UPI003558F411